MSLAELAVLAALSRLPWVSLAGTGVQFAPEVSVAVAPQSRLGPPGWTALVSIAGEVIATAPDPATADTAQQALAGLRAASVTDAGVLASRLNIAEILGPATLAYLDAADFRRRDGAPVILVGPTDLEVFIEAVDPDDRAESGIEEITSPVFAVWEDDRVCATAGYRDWPGRTAHLSVLTGPWARDRGLARVAASAAVAHALASGLLPSGGPAPALPGTSPWPSVSASWAPRSACACAPTTAGERRPAGRPRRRRPVSAVGPAVRSAGLRPLGP